MYLRLLAVAKAAWKTLKLDPAPLNFQHYYTRTARMLVTALQWIRITCHKTRYIDICHIPGMLQSF